MRSMREIRIRNVPWRLYKSYLREARKHNHSLEDEIRDTIFQYVMERYPSQRGLLISKLSRGARLRFLKRERAYKHLIH
jgi:plasmid stability protein